MLKLHGTGNTFYLLEYPQEDLKQRAVTLCKDGTDGVLYIEKSDTALSKMRIFNADGSEPEMCGNGLRCFARYILEEHGLKEGLIETLHNHYFVRYVEDFYGMVGIEIELYPVKALENSEVKKLNETTMLDYAYYDVSNPHVVLEGPQRVSAAYLTNQGLLSNQLFEAGINVNMLTVYQAGKIYVQTYERGVGITKSCGTGMTASSVHYAKTYNYFDKDIEVYNDGGMIRCRVVVLDNAYKVYFLGNASYIADYENDQIVKVYEKESEAYELFLNTQTIEMGK